MDVILSMLTLIFFTILVLYATNHLAISLKAAKKQRRLELDMTVRPPGEWPKVSVHLPFHNERRVAARILSACLAFDYPRDKLEIIVVDDSDDGTTEIARRFEDLYPSMVRVLHRVDRRGFKAGALNLALAHSRGDLIAVFDADYIPPPSFLRETVPYLLSEEKVAFLQTRCGHLNADYNWVTRAAVAAHEWFWGREQKARYETGFFTHFGGTGGLFKREALMESGGWPEGTLTEDLDLSVRLHLKGWKYLYIPEIVCPGELPPSFKALLRQQHRWAKGFTQCLLKHASNILKSRRLTFTQKVEAIMQLSSYLTAPATLGLMASLTLLWMACPPDILKLTGLTLLGESLIPLSIGAAALRREDKEMNGNAQRKTSLQDLAYLILMTLPMLIVYTKGVLEALLGVGSPFRRTPKYGLITEKTPHPTRQPT